jgi:hypothetical protein
MFGARVLQGQAARRLPLLVTAILICAALVLTALAESAAAGLVAKDGKVYACYRTKGKAKGTVRLVAKQRKCRKGEKKISWSATGPAGENGQSGANGESGAGGGAPGAAGLEGRIEKLTDRVETLESKLKGITNAALAEALSKLQGISATQLQEAVKGIANVNALCAQGKKLTEQVNSLGGALGAAEVIGGLGLSLLFPQALPSPLASFGCPA